MNSKNKTISSQNSVSFKVTIKNNHSTNHSIRVLYVIPTLFLPLRQISCTPSTFFENMTIPNYVVMNSSIANSIIICTILTVAGIVSPGKIYEVIVYAADNTDKISCYKYASASLMFKAAKISPSYSSTTDTSNLSLGDHVNLTVQLRFPKISVNGLVVNVSFENNEHQSMRYVFYSSLAIFQKFLRLLVYDLKA